ncbi:hypothetical protein LRS06_24755 [Hymenobacter sp. J193]|uniref:hypothetical protein n=1 Tax=Hymenobacter sp. J193 TaxID=2898429 RepID=UPI002151B070|nr:hypothetical protein [Hymenobacter sp. J193]MCR5890937.1 hypothetical protein [Hymenobacter sp. J193]
MPRLLLFCLLLLTLASCHSQVRYAEGAAVYQLGDDPRWAARQYDDSGWRPERGPVGGQVCWTRNWLTLHHRNPHTPLGLQIGAFGAFEVYWDGTLIGQNGQLPAGQQAEVPGTETSYYQVPDSLARPGRHLVALRSTQTYLPGEERGTHIRLDSYPRLLQGPLLITSFMNLMAGAFLIAAVYYLFLFLNSRRKEPAVLVFSLICFLFLRCCCWSTLSSTWPFPTRSSTSGWKPLAGSLLLLPCWCHCTSPCSFGLRASACFPYCC